MILFSVIQIKVLLQIRHTPNCSSALLHSLQVQKKNVMLSPQVTGTVCAPRVWTRQDISQQPLIRQGQSTHCPKAKTTSSYNFALLHLLWSLAPWPSPCQRSWQQGGSSRRLSHIHSEATGLLWRWMSTAPTPLRLSPSTISTRDASSRLTFTCE